MRSVIRCCLFAMEQIWETPHKRHHIFIEFYDVRAAEAALRSLHNTEIAGMRLKIEPSSHGGTCRKYVYEFDYVVDSCLP